MVLTIPKLSRDCARRNYEKSSNWTLTLASLSSTAGVLGTPDQDPVVKSIQKSFANAKAPTETDLKLGHKGICREFTSVKDDFYVYDETTSLIFKFLMA